MDLYPAYRHETIRFWGGGVLVFAPSPSSGWRKCEPKGLCEIRRRRRHRIGREAADVSGAVRHARHAATAAAQESKADFTLRIAPVTVELTPTRIISTIGYNGTSPGRCFACAKASRSPWTSSTTPTCRNWCTGTACSFPPEVDGVEEEATPMVPPHGRIRYQFTPRPAGTRWYHTHTMAGADLHRGAYTGQFGFLMIESANNPGNYDQEVFLALREWEPFFNPEEEDDDDASQLRPAARAAQDSRHQSRRASKSATRCFRSTTKPWARANRFACSQGERVLMHLLNASASMNRRIALPGHRFSESWRWTAIRFPRRNRSMSSTSAPASASTPSWK